MIRFALKDDGEAILNIYRQYIDTPVTFETRLPALAEFMDRIVQISAYYPYLVYEQEGEVLGYAYAHRQMEREAYQWNAELSIYLSDKIQSKGIGTRLYTTLIQLLKLQGIKNVYAGVTVPNEKSERLHEGFGFRRLGIYHKTGYKNRAWHDVCWFEKEISSRQGEPMPVLPIGLADQEKVQAILAQTR